jgi:hypothetical protein
MDILTDLKTKNNILFGPFVGEVGWEIFRWSGFVRKYKSDHPNKKIIVCSRNDMYDLYNGYIDEFVPLEIQNEKPDCYLARNLQNHDEILKSLTEKYPNYYILNPSQFGLNRNVFGVSDMSFELTPREKNIAIIESIVFGINKSILVIAPRHRQDETKRNWGVDRWMKFYELIFKSKEYFTIIAGKSPSFVVPPKNYGFYILEEFVDDQSSLIGLTTEAIKRSKLTIGSQSSIPQLSLLLKTPVISWGNQKRRHSIDENIMRTKCVFFDDPKYTIDPSIIFQEVSKNCK